jgi:uncharacterized protein (TIGR00369 family)
MKEKIHELTNIINKIPFNRTLGLQLDVVEKDRIAMRFEMKEDLVGNFFHGILHGGVTSAVLDMAGGAAAMVATALKHTEKSLVELGDILGKSSTINLHIDYLRPGRGTHFTAKAWVIQSGNKITFARMELLNNESVLIASGTGTYLMG